MVFMSRSLLLRRFLPKITWKPFRRSVSMVSSGKINIELNDKTGVCDIVLKNKPVNVLDNDVLSNILSVTQEAEKSSNIKAIVISSSLPNFFSSGLDIHEFLNAPKDWHKFHNYVNLMLDVYMALYKGKTISVAAIDGTCFAGGCVLAMSCDYRIATRGKYKIGVIEASMGMDVPFWICDMFQAQCGIGEGMRQLPYGLPYDVQSAERIGLIDRTCEQKELRSTVDMFLNHALKIQDEARYNTKMYLRRDVIKKIEAGRDKDMKYKADLFQTPEMHETMKKYYAATFERKK